MNAISRLLAVTLGGTILSTIFVANAFAGCGDLGNLRGPFAFARADGEGHQQSSAAIPGPSSATIVGFWKVQFISKGNTTHNPSIPDGALIDFGFSQWHSDGTEILNSGGHSPASGNFCLGVWEKTGFLTFELNHFPIAYDPTTGAIANYINIRERNTLSASGDSYTGTFTLTVYDPQGNQVDQLKGTIAATRLTLDSTIPGAIPSN